MPVEVIFFNVGQGDCTFLHFYDSGPGGARTSKRTVLLDCGTFAGGDVPPGRPSAPASGDDRKRLLTHLRHEIGTRLAENSGVLNYLLISHPDQDHYRNLEELLCHLDPKGKPTGKLQYGIENVWYSCDPSNYREGNARGARGAGGTGKGFVGRLLTSPADLACAEHPPHKVDAMPVRIQSPVDPMALFPAPTFGTPAPVPPAPAELPNLFLVSSQPFGPLPDKWSAAGSSRSPEAGNKLKHPGDTVPPRSLPADAALRALLKEIGAVKDKIKELRLTESKNLAGAALDQRLEDLGWYHFGEQYLDTFPPTERETEMAKAAQEARNAGRVPPRWLIRSAKDSQEGADKQQTWFRKEGQRRLGETYVTAGGEPRKEELRRYIAGLPRPQQMGDDEYEDYLESKAVEHVTDAHLKSKSEVERNKEIADASDQITNGRQKSNEFLRKNNADHVPPRNHGANEYNRTLAAGSVPLPDPAPVSGSDPADYNGKVATYNAQVQRYNAEVAEYNRTTLGAKKRPLDSMSLLQLNLAGDDLKRLAEAWIISRYVEALLTEYRQKTRDVWEKTAKTDWANGSSMVFVLKGKPGSDGKHQQVWLMADAVMVNEDLLRNRYASAADGGWQATEDVFVKDAKNRWLKVGHHGSGTSTSAEWITFLKPIGMFVSSGLKDYHIPRASHFEDKVMATWDRTSPPDIDPPDTRPGTTGVGRPPHQHDYAYWQDRTPAGTDFKVVWKQTRRALGTSLTPTAADKAPKPAPSSASPKRRKLMDFEGQGTDWHLILDDTGGFELWYH
ncbi:hypothetical protein [Streptomyces coffeae]|uniref:MBL fold metallo-hydrolase n=1 Tax=Streptomyces coffeae TaxID=621382 RepID=A0ABS1NRY3_9ACTN|nr:hypothetical protein [Streptomyces coffeae]MBL1102580.1 hypothetical protein [Streptomyces coffeae]